MDTALLKATVPSESGSESFEKKLSILRACGRGVRFDYEIKLRQSASVFQSASREIGGGQSWVPAVRRASFAKASARQGRLRARRGIFFTGSLLTATNFSAAKDTKTPTAFSRISITLALCSRSCSPWSI